MHILYCYNAFVLKSCLRYASHRTLHECVKNATDAAHAFPNQTNAMLILADAVKSLRP